MFDTLTKIVGLTIASGSVLVGGYQGVTWTHDKVQQIDQLATHVFLIAERLESKIQQDNLNAIQTRQWNLEDRYKGSIEKAPQTVREEYRKLEAEKAELEKKLQEIEQQVQSKQKEN